MKHLILSFFLISVFSLSSGAFASGAKVTAVSGTVRYNGKIVKVGDELERNGEIEVGPEKEASVDLKYPQGHLVRLKSQSKMRIEESKDGGLVDLNLIRGKIYAHLLKEKGAEKFHIKTKAVVAGVRGTKFLVEENESKGSYVCVCEGSVEVTGTGEHQADGARIVNAGEDIWARPGKTMGKPKVDEDMSKQTSSEFESMK